MESRYGPSSGRVVEQAARVASTRTAPRSLDTGYATWGEWQHKSLMFLVCMALCGIFLIILFMTNFPLMVAVLPWLFFLALAVVGGYIGLRYHGIWVENWLRKTFVPDGALGNYPVDVRTGRLLAMPGHMAPDVLPRNLSYRYDTKVSEEQRDIQQIAAPLVFPQAPAFATIADQITPERLLLGYNTDGAIWGEMTDLLSTMVAGLPGGGKTTALRFILAQLLRTGGEAVIWDPHASIADEVSTQIDCAVSPQEIDASVSRVSHVLDRRLALRLKPHEPWGTHLLIIDEWPLVNDMSPDALRVMKYVVQQGRKVQMYVLLASQTMEAKLFDGSGLNGCIATRYVFYSDNRQGKIAGLTNEVANTMLPPLMEAPRGIAVLSSLRKKPQYVAIPQTVIADVQLALGNTGTHKVVSGSLSDDGYTPGMYFGDIFSHASETKKLAMEDIPVRVPPSKKEPISEEQLQEAREAYEKGYTSRRLLASILGETEHRAMQLLQALGGRLDG